MFTKFLDVSCILARCDASSPLSALTSSEPLPSGLDACDSVARAVLPKMWLQRWVMPWLVNQPVRLAMDGWPMGALDDGFIPWDVVALLAAVRPHLFTRWEKMRASFDVCGEEPCDGTMRVEPTSASDYAGLVRVPFLGRLEEAVASARQILLNKTIFLENVLDLICSVPSNGPTPRPKNPCAFMTLPGCNWASSSRFP